MRNAHITLSLFSLKVILNGSPIHFFCSQLHINCALWKVLDGNSLLSHIFLMG